RPTSAARASTTILPARWPRAGARSRTGNARRSTNRCRAASARQREGSSRTLGAEQWRNRPARLPWLLPDAVAMPWSVVGRRRCRGLLLHCGLETLHEYRQPRLESLLGELVRLGEQPWHLGEHHLTDGGLIDRRHVPKLLFREDFRVDARELGLEDAPVHLLLQEGLHDALVRLQLRHLLQLRRHNRV